MKHSLKIISDIFFLACVLFLFMSCKKKSVDIGMRFTAQYYDSASYLHYFLDSNARIAIDTHQRYTLSDNYVLLSINGADALIIRKDTFTKSMIRSTAETAFYYISSLPPKGFWPTDWNWDETHGTNLIYTYRDTMVVVSQYFSRSVRQVHTLKAAIQ